MAFCIFPPKGTTQLQQLTSCSRKRLEFLLKVANCHGRSMQMRDLVQEEAVVTDADCLIEGSKKDAVSHFVLRLACCQSAQMEDFFIRAEVLLFKYRVSCMRSCELNTLVRPLRKLWRIIKGANDRVDCDEADQFWLLDKDVLSPWLHHAISLNCYMTQQYDWKTLINGYEDGSNKIFMIIPFQFVTDLVAKRSVELIAGRAYIPCSKFCDLLTLIFKNLLLHGVEMAKRQLTKAEEDPRVKSLVKALKALYTSSVRSEARRHGNAHLLSEDVDQAVAAFPLCMSHLHQTLRSQHRLQHFDRIQYTLFLKEVGMPVNEALHFWRSEYSKSSDFNEHAWQKDARRYTYNIRHLYGLEGARHNYRGHSCFSLQSRDVSSCQAGGCPFKHFDVDHLRAKLKSEGINDDEHDDILILSTAGEYSSACLKYLILKIEQSLPKSEKMIISSQSPSSHEQDTARESDLKHCVLMNNQKDYKILNDEISSGQAEVSTPEIDDFTAGPHTLASGNSDAENVKRNLQVENDQYLSSERGCDACGGISHGCCPHSHVLGCIGSCHLSQSTCARSDTVHQLKSVDCCNDDSTSDVKIHPARLKHDSFEVNSSHIYKPVDYFHTYTQLLNGLT